VLEILLKISLPNDDRFERFVVSGCRLVSQRVLCVHRRLQFPGIHLLVFAGGYVLTMLLQFGDSVFFTGGSQLKQ
jgi:hypothetical protein